MKRFDDGKGLNSDESSAHTRARHDARAHQDTNAHQNARVNQETRAHQSAPTHQDTHASQKTRTRQDTPACRCPVSAACGGCTRIEEPYECQLEWKNAQVEKLFSELAPRGVCRPILGMENPFYYRDKVISPYAPGKRLPSAKTSAGRGKGASAAAERGALRREVLTGMYAAGSHRLIPTAECLTENREAKAVTLAVRDIMQRHGMQPYDEDAGTGFIRHAVVRVGHGSGEMLVTLVTNGEEFPAAKSFCRELVKRCPQVTTVVQNVNERRTNVILGQKERTLYGPGFILDTLCGLTFRISSKSFYQINCTQTEVLYRTAIGLAQLSGYEHVIDAYCGTGTMGLVAAHEGAAQVIGVDSVADAVRDARQNARHNGIRNARFQTADAGDFLRDMAARGESAHVLLMDPPRAGASEEFLAAAATLGPTRIVYVSCNPTTQVRDIRILKQSGYEVRAVQPVDMFPHTDHIETVALLERMTAQDGRGKVPA